MGCCCPIRIKPDLAYSYQTKTLSPDKDTPTKIKIHNLIRSDSPIPDNLVIVIHPVHRIGEPGR